LLCILLLPFVSVADETITIAVASNFKSTADEIASEFSAATSIQVRVSSGSTGKLYAQIFHGAPYDVFLSADSKRPAMLEENGLAIANSRITYAVGGLVLWSQDDTLRGADCRRVLQEGRYRWLALANPKTAPYGRAAREFLLGAKLWDDVNGRTVIGENVSQALQFVATKNATLGLIAVSQTKGVSTLTPTCSWPVPPSMHAPIVQQAVVIRRSPNRSAAMSFLNFLQGPVATEILQRRGYSTAN